MNLPGHYIHDVGGGYGWLVLPIGRGRWLAYFKRCGFRVTWWKGFHNCTWTGVDDHH